MTTHPTLDRPKDTAVNSYQRAAQIDNRRAAVLISLTLAFLAGVGVGSISHAEPSQPQIAYQIDQRGDVDGTTGEGQDTPDDVIFEDDPRWDCHTMGNLICGSGR